MDVSVIFRYLKDLAANNNRDWFNAHRDAYETARKEFENLLTAVIRTHLAVRRNHPRHRSQGLYIPYLP